jgi:hypothetical protein
VLVVSSSRTLLSVQLVDRDGSVGFVVEAYEPLDRAISWALVNRLMVEAGELSPQVAALIRSALDLQMPGSKFPTATFVDLGKAAATKPGERS